MVPSLSAFDPSSHITIKNIAVDDDKNPAMIQFTLKASKTDPFRKGVQVAVGKTEDDICPVRVLMAFLAVRGSKPGPLFCSQNSSPFIRSQFVCEIKKALQQLGYDSSKFVGHSFRAGAATAAAAAGLEDSLIKILGRWESSAYQAYVHLPNATFSRVSKFLSSASLQ